jgi:hypothetical protein
MTGWRVTSLSPTTSTIQPSQTHIAEPTRRKAAFAAISRYIFQALFGLCEQVPSLRHFMCACLRRQKSRSRGSDPNFGRRRRTGVLDVWTL